MVAVPHETLHTHEESKPSAPRISDRFFKFVNRMLDRHDSREQNRIDTEENDDIFRRALDEWATQTAAKINQLGLTRDMYVRLRDKNSEELCALIAKITDKEKFHQVFRTYKNQES